MQPEFGSGVEFSDSLKAARSSAVPLLDHIKCRVHERLHVRTVRRFLCGMNFDPHTSHGLGEIWRAINQSLKVLKKQT